MYSRQLACSAWVTAQLARLVQHFVAIPRAGCRVPQSSNAVSTLPGQTAGAPGHPLPRPLQALEKYTVEKDVAAYIKKDFDAKHGPTWHCIVGRNFGACTMRRWWRASAPEKPAAVTPPSTCRFIRDPRDEALCVLLPGPCGGAAVQDGLRRMQIASRLVLNDFTRSCTASANRSPHQSFARTYTATQPC